LYPTQNGVDNLKWWLNFDGLKLFRAHFLKKCSTEIVVSSVRTSIARSRYGARWRPPSTDPFSRAAAAEKISAFLSAAAEPAAAYKFRRVAA
jgi:hypothetical protein